MQMKKTEEDDKTPQCHHSSCPSEQQSIITKRVECAAQLAAKQAEMKMEEAIATQRLELKRLEYQRDLQVIAAKVKQTSCTCTSVFSGDPLKFLVWRTSFKALIERRCRNPADKLFYLQKYVSGEAQSVLEGSFYRKCDEAYDQAWEALNSRYGHPFVIQRVFQEKLNHWPKIGLRESVKLRQFSDFLTACSNAMPHIKRLQVLNDCEENQKMLQKLPDWLTSHWNRHETTMTWVKPTAQQDSDGHDKLQQHMPKIEVGILRSRDVEIESPRKEAEP
ncbi:FHA domain-containing protein PS1 [Labeo rohita]|uniref:FHA domain-containing protein PS1 n=1 Tax=Labeo rohita TaxID=84645 RepID=A0ABQ8MXC6_LABRO|nr:FHA domain-containing protein PS1 [Labeo rohita]